MSLPTLRTPAASLGRREFGLLAVVTLGLGSLVAPPHVSAILTLAGLASLFLALRADDLGDSEMAGRMVGLGILVGLVLTSWKPVGPSAPTFGAIQPVWLTLVGFGALLFALGVESSAIRRVSVALCLLGFIVVSLFVVIQEWNSDRGLDVYLSHQAAAGAIAEGINPYTDAVVVPNGSPWAPDGSVITGYAYPPSTLIGYAGPRLLGLDPRITSLAAGLLLCAWLAFRAWRSDFAVTASALSIGVSGLSVWPVVQFSGWTEPLTAGLLLIAAVNWGRPLASAILLGLALGSKQYMVFAGVVLLLYSGSYAVQRKAVALGLVVGLLAFALALGPVAFIDAIFVNLLEIGFRPDSQSLSGLLKTVGIEYNLAPLAWVGISLLVALILGHGVNDRSGFIAGTALALGVAFWLGQAFPNYWYLVTVLAAIWLGGELPSKVGAEKTPPETRVSLGVDGESP